MFHRSPRTEKELLVSKELSTAPRADLLGAHETESLRRARHEEIATMIYQLRKVQELREHINGPFLEGTYLPSLCPSVRNQVLSCHLLYGWKEYPLKVSCPRLCSALCLPKPQGRRIWGGGWKVWRPGSGTWRGRPL